ncbi:hypothetical protein [Actinophytocola sediminis]
MVERHSWAVGAVDDTGQITEVDARLTIGGLLTPTGPTTSRSGLFPAADAAGAVTATTPTPTGEVHVAPFRGSRQSVRPGGGGSYLLCLDTVKTIDVLGTAPADPANPRIDLIVFQQSDTYHGDTDSDLRVRHVVGTPSFSPVAPDPTEGGWSPDYVVKARITVPAGAETISQDDINNIDLGVTVAVGGVLPVADRTWRDAIINPYEGLVVYRRERDWLESYDGTTWRGTRQVSYSQPNAVGPGANAPVNAGQNTTYTVATVEITDPGWPYLIAGCAGMRLTAVSSNVGYISHAGSITVDSTVQPEVSETTNANTVSIAFLEVTGTNFPNPVGFLNLPYRRARTVYTGAHTVRFLFKTGLQGTVSFGPLNQQADYYFHVDVIPA